MRRLALLLALASLHGLTPASAQPIDPYPDGIGIYFDTGATQYCTSWTGGQISAYVVVTNGTELSGISGYEFRLDFEEPAGSFLMGYTLPPNAINADSPPGFLVGLAAPVPYSTSIVILTINMLEFQGNEWTFKIFPNDTPSIPGVPSYAAGANPSLITPLRQSSGGADVPVAFLNRTCEPAPCDHAFEVNEFVPGGGTDATSADDLLGPPDAAAVSLGLTGTVSVGLPFAIVDGLGVDFRIHELGAAAGEVDENYSVEGSVNGIDYVPIGEGSGGISDFDMVGAGIDEIFYLRITDLAPLESGNPPGQLGADIDAVEMLRCGGQNCPHGDVFAECRTIAFTGILFGERYAIDSSDIPLPPGQPFFFDSTSVTLTRSENDIFHLSGAPGVLSDWVCGDQIFINGEYVPPIAFSYINDPTFPVCVPIDSVYVPIPARDITPYIPLGTNCVTFQLADALRGAYGNSEIYLVKESIVPTLLSHFFARRQTDSVVITWETAVDSRADDFRLIGRTAGQEWEVEHSAKSQSAFQAIDASPHLAAADLVTYSLYYLGAGRETLLKSQTINLGDLPAATGIVGVQPNPFNPRTTISFSLGRPQPVRLAVYDLTGRWIALLADEQYGIGIHSIQWDGKDASGRGVGSGAYLLRMETPDAVQTEKLMLLR